MSLLGVRPALLSRTNRTGLPAGESASRGPLKRLGQRNQVHHSQEQQCRGRGWPSVCSQHVRAGRCWILGISGSLFSLPLSLSLYLSLPLSLSVSVSLSAFLSVSVSNSVTHLLTGSPGSGPTPPERAAFTVSQSGCPGVGLLQMASKTLLIAWVTWRALC